jgi:hypothetical protein
MAARACADLVRRLTRGGEGRGTIAVAPRRVVTYRGEPLEALDKPECPRLGNRAKLESLYVLLLPRAVRRARCMPREWEAFKNSAEC